MHVWVSSFLCSTKNSPGRRPLAFLIRLKLKTIGHSGLLALAIGGKRGVDLPFLQPKKEREHLFNPFNIRSQKSFQIHLQIINQKYTFFTLFEGLVSRILLDSIFGQFRSDFERVNPQSTRHGAVETHVGPFCGKRAKRSILNEKTPPKRSLKTNKNDKQMF